MKWLKLWTEARNDGKLRALSDFEHRIWFRLLCYAAEQEPSGIVRASWKLLAAECADGAVDPLQKAVTEMQSLQLVTCVTCNVSEVEITFPSFAKRQAKFPSDDKKRVAERVAKCRRNKKMRQQSFLVTTCNEHVTARNDPEADIENKKIPPTPKGEKRPFSLPDWMPADDWNAYVEMRQKIRKPMTDHAKDLAVKKLARFRDAGEDPAELLQAATLGSWQGIYSLRKGPRDSPPPAPPAPARPETYFDPAAYLKELADK